MYLHLPRNPATGCLTSRYDNNLAPVVLKARNCKSQRLRKYCTLWQVVKVHGAWNGIDVLYLSDDSMMSETDQLLYEDQMLMYYFRSSTRDYVEYLVETKVWSERMKTEISVDSAKKWDHVDIDPYVCGSTMITFRDALRIRCFTDSNERFIVNEVDGTDKLFYAGWPNTFTYIHPATKHGAQPIMCREFKRALYPECFLPYLMLFFVSKFPALWEMIDDKMDSVHCWSGWFLEHVSRNNLIPTMKRTKRRSTGGKLDSNPFVEGLTADQVFDTLMEEIRNACHIEDDTELPPSFSVPNFATLFGSIHTAKVHVHEINSNVRSIIDVLTHTVNNSCDPSCEYLLITKSASCWRDTQSMMSCTVDDIPFSFQSDEHGRVFKCCLVANTQINNDDDTFSIQGTFRHFDVMFSDWWYVGSNSMPPYEAKYYKFNNPLNTARAQNASEFQVDEGTGFPRYLQRSWNLLLYVREGQSIDALRDAYLDSLGCSHGINCAVHRRTLVFSSNKDKRKCSFCHKIAKFECETYTCELRLCKEHYELAKGKHDVSGNRQYVSAVDDVSNDGDEVDGNSSLDSSYHSTASSHDSTSYHTASSSHSSSSSFISSHESHDLHDLGNADNISNDGNHQSISQEHANHDEWKEFEGEVRISKEGTEKYEGDLDLLDEMYNDDTLDFMGVGDEDDDDMRLMSSSEDRIPTTIATDMTTDQDTGRLKFADRTSCRMNLFIFLNSSGGNLLLRKGKSVLGTREQQSFLQRIQARCGRSLPLLYPMGLLCPSVCYKEFSDGTIPGSFTNSMLTDEQQLAKLNVASLHDHNLIQLTDSTLKCSGDARYIEVLFSIESNLALRGKRTTLITGPRGFEELYDTGGPQIANNTKKRHNEFVCDETDGFRSVQCLQSMMRDLKSSLFYTNTLNERYFPGVNKVRKLIDELVETIALCQHSDDVDGGEGYAYSVRQISAFHIYRAYHKVMDLIFRWITTSKEMPFGEIEEWWIKWELQLQKSVTGSFDHSHALFFPPNHVWKDRDTYIAKCLKLIRCSEETLINDEDIAFFNRLGLHFSPEHLEEVRSNINKFQSHVCKLDARCSRIDKEGNRHCRKPNYYKMNPDPNTYNFVRINDCYSDESKRILLRLGFMAIHNDGTFVPLDLNLKPGLWTYPTNNQVKFSPCNPLFAMMLRSTHNLLLCDDCMSKRYLTNYNALVDHGAKASLSANKKSGEVEVLVDEIPNQKIKGNRINSKASGTNDATVVTLPFIFRCLMHEKEIDSNARYVSVPTVPLENRGGVVIKPKREIRDASSVESVNRFVQLGISGTFSIGSPPSILARNELRLPSWRQFTDSQKIEIRDALYSKASSCNVKSFSIRPPEFLFIDSLSHFTQYCYNKPCTTKTIKVGNRSVSPSLQLLKKNIDQSPWLDGLERSVYIRKCSIHLVLQTYSEHMNPRMKRLLHAIYYHQTKSFLFPSLPSAFRNQIENIANKLTISHFICDEDDEDDIIAPRLPHIVYHNIRPSKGEKFLYHLLLRYGKFVTEADLWNASTIQGLFQNAKLLPSGVVDKSTIQAHIDSILTTWIAEEAFGYPTGQKVISMYICQAQHLLQEALYRNMIPSAGIPPFLYVTLFKSAQEAQEQRLYHLKDQLLSTILSKLSHLQNIPTKEEFLTVTIDAPLEWQPRLRQLDGQSRESFYEQRQALKFLCEKVDKYFNMEADFKKHTILHGPPGCGKTFLGLLQVLYAISKGLFSTVTSIPSKRARECGGTHIAQLILLRGHQNDKISSNPQLLADDIIKRLFSNPLHLNVLRVLSLLLLEEGGLFSSELLAAINSTVGYIRHNPDYFAGMLTTITMDIEQLQNISGHPILMSPNIITAYDIINLQHFVRSRHDIPQQKLLRIMANWDERTMQMEREFKAIVREHCNFVRSWDDSSITPQHLRIFSKRIAVEKSEKDYVSRYIEIQTNMKIFHRTAVDEQSERRSFHVWEDAGYRTKKLLNKKTKMQETLIIYNNMKVSMSYNEIGVFDQGQLAIVRCKETLSQDDIKNWCPIQLLISSIGTSVPPENFESIPTEQMIELGWTLIQVKKITSETESVNYTTISRRSQYPFSPQNGLTMHKIIGDTVRLGVTQVDDDKNSDYYIWEKGDTVVLLSRFSNLSDLIFVSPKGEEATIKVLMDTLDKTDDFYPYVKEIIRNQAIVFEETSLHHPTMTSQKRKLHVHNLHFFPYRAKDHVFPEKSAIPNGALYMLLSKSKRCQSNSIQKIYIGETVDIKERIRYHNSGCNNVADPFYRPWVPLVYFTGFDSHHQRKSLESTWQKQTQSFIQQMHGVPLINEIIALGKGLCERATITATSPNTTGIIMHTCFIAPEVTNVTEETTSEPSRKKHKRDATTEHIIAGKSMVYDIHKSASFEKWEGILM